MNETEKTGVNIRPRYMVWENVPGAFSSNKGEDFRIVLEELAKIADKDAVIPMPEKGKWTTCGCIVGDGWSIAWRVLDAQFWRVPKRRRRIALVADFGGESAPEILFVRKSVSGHTDESKPQRKETSSDATGGIGADDREGEIPYTLKIRSGCEGGGKGALVQEDKSATLACNNDQYLFQPIYALDRASFNQGKNAQYDFEISDKGVNSPLVAKGPSAVAYPTISMNWQAAAGAGLCVEEEVINPLACTRVPAVCYGESVAQAVDCRNFTEDDVNGSLQSNSAHSLNGNNVVRIRYIVRRLTPLECERLQGYPDGWTDIGKWIDSNGKKRQTSDAARYKALGNSIALPPWKWVLKRLCACYERDATMASLFDGIGGFPYLWEQLNGKGTCLWASEIEEFPMAVTKVRIGE